MDPTPMGTTQPANRGRALILGVLHAMAVPTEPKSGMGIVATIRRTTVVTADMVLPTYNVKHEAPLSPELEPPVSLKAGKLWATINIIKAGSIIIFCKGRVNNITPRMGIGWVDAVLSWSCKRTANETKRFE